MQVLQVDGSADTSATRDIDVMPTTLVIDVGTGVHLGTDVLVLSVVDDGSTTLVRWSHFLF